MAALQHVASGARVLLAARHVVGRAPACDLRLVSTNVSGIVKFKLQVQRNSNVGLIQNKNLLGGDKGSYCVGLSHITDDDLLAMIDARLVSASSEAAFAQECCEIGQFISLTNHLSEMVPLFELNAKLPWDKADMGIKKWVKRRAVDLDEVFRVGEGYGPLDPECVTQIIERSLHLVLEQSDHLSELARLLRSYKHGEVNTAPPAKQLLHTYGPIFRDATPTVRSRTPPAASPR